ncbi:MazG nucleotide pyrophosphohydrolase domain-containing protein [Aquimarina celericrescens]|uniref:MazG nucleotide pyrophosphohydrolase domain-containing protein n=1 Tax=Aquimarina celericrescens TaxID=1964542 RepID=A0ABW5B0Q3_9FLAO|nr:hypothetical protein [Aquimarina celericrescens]
MERNSIQELVKDFVLKNKYETTIEIRMLDLLSELGELSKELIISSNYGKLEISTEEKIKDEFGDVLFSLICIANLLEINMEQQIIKTLDKYKKRLITKGRISSN